MLSLLSFSASILYLYFGFYVLKLDRKSAQNIVFFIICSTLAIWSFTYSFIYPETNIETCLKWYKFTSFGWCTIFSTLLHFFSICAKMEKLLRSKWFYILVYLPPSVFVCKVFTGTVLVKGFTPGNFGTVEIHEPNSIWYKLFVAYLIIYLFTGFILIFIWGKRTTILREKKQSHIMLISAAIPFIVGFSINIALPSTGSYAYPSTAQLFILIWLFAIWHSIVKYRLMVLTPKIASDEIFNKIKDLLIIVDDTSRIIKVNPSLLEVLGYDYFDLIGKDISVLFLPHTLQGSKSLKMPDNIYSCSNLEIELTTKSGKPVPVNLSAEQITDVVGQIAGVIMLCQDIRPTIRLKQEISERKLIESGLIETTALLESQKSILENQNILLEAKNRELILSRKQLQEAQTQLVQNENMASVGQLTAAIAHEINNPLGAINSNVQIFEIFINMLMENNELKDNEEFYSTVLQMKEANDINILACQRVMEIIRSLKTFSRLDEAEFKEANINECIRSVLVLTSNMWKSRIKMHESYGLIKNIKCFPGQLNQVFMNIISNAIQAIDGEGDIYINTYNDDNSLYISIKDTGTGVNPENLTKIFNPGFSTKGVGIGLGLGLSISYNIIKKHNGEIKVFSEINKGTEFLISIPFQNSISFIS